MCIFIIRNGDVGRENGFGERSVYRPHHACELEFYHEISRRIINVPICKKEALAPDDARKRFREFGYYTYCRPRLPYEVLLSFYFMMNYPSTL